MFTFHAVVSLGIQLQSNTICRRHLCIPLVVHLPIIRIKHKMPPYHSSQKKKLHGKKSQQKPNNHSKKFRHHPVARLLNRRAVLSTPGLGKPRNLERTERRIETLAIDPRARVSRAGPLSARASDVTNEAAKTAVHKMRPFFERKRVIRDSWKIDWRAQPEFVMKFSVHFKVDSIFEHSIEVQVFVSNNVKSTPC